MGRAVPLALLLATAAVAAAAAVPACVPPSSVLSVATDRCCLDQAHTIDPDSSPAYIAGVLAHLSYPTSVRLRHKGPPPPPPLPLPAVAAVQLHAPPSAAAARAANPRVHPALPCPPRLALAQFPELPMNCSDACVDFQAPFAAVAQAMGATDVAFVNGAEDHLSACAAARTAAAAGEEEERAAGLAPRRRRAI